MSENTASKKALVNPFDGKEIVDSLGRKLRLRKPNILDRYDLMSALGEDANNSVCLNYALPVLHLFSIDGQVLETCRNIREFRAALKWLGEEGIEAIFKFIASLDEEAVSEKEAIEQVKK